MVREHVRRGPRRPATALATWSGRVALIVGVVCLGLGVVTPPAGADNARIAAEARCDRVVSWVVQAVADTSGGKADTQAEADRVRTNDSVEVSYRPAKSTSKSDAGWIPVKTSALNTANDFTFSGSFPLPDSVDSVELRVLPKVAWADGSKAGSPKFAVATVPTACASIPAVAVITPDCKAGGAVVNMRNAGDDMMEQDLSVDGVVVRSVKLGANADEQVTVPILAGTSSVIRVNAGDFVVAQRKVDSGCDRSDSSAVVLERCSVHQAVVSARLGEGSDKTGDAAGDGSGAGGSGDGSGAGGGGDAVEIRAAGTIVHKAKLTSGKVFQRTLDLPSDGPTDLEVTIGGRTAAIGSVGSCDGPIVGAVSCGGKGQPACVAKPKEPELEVPPIPPPPLTIEFDSNGLPVTGPWERAIALLFGGALLSVGGLVIIGDQRRRPKPSLVAESVAAYQRQWWT